MSSQRLNPDVLGLILGYADREAIKSVSLGSIALRGAAFPFLFRRLSFDLEDSIRLRADVSDKALLHVKQIQLRIDESSKAVSRDGEPHDGGPLLLAPTLETVVVENHFPVRQRSYTSYKAILTACRQLLGTHIEISVGRVDWCGTDFCAFFFDYAVAKCLGACHVIRPDAILSVNLSSPWLSTTHSFLSAVSHSQILLGALSLRECMLNAEKLHIIGGQLLELHSLKFDFSDVRTAGTWVPKGFGSLVRLGIAYRKMEHLTSSLRVYRRLLGHLAHQLEELDILGTQARREGPEWDLCAEIEMFPKLRTVSAAGTTVYLLLRKGALPSLQHLVIRNCRYNVPLAPDDLFWHEGLPANLPPLVRAIRVGAPITLVTAVLDNCRPAYLEEFQETCPRVQFTATRLLLSNLRGCTRLALASGTHLVFEKGIEADDLQQHSGLSSHVLETVEFADEREENKLFLEKLDSPNLRKVTVRKDFEY